MEFYTVHDLQTESAAILESLHEGHDIIITREGHPAALMIDIDQDNSEEVLQAVRQAKAMIAFNAMRLKAASRCLMNEEEIEAEIADVRREE